MKELGSDKLESFYLNWRLIFIGLILLALVLAIMIAPLLTMLLSLQWPETPCIILNSEVKLVSARSYAPSNEYKIQIQFMYNFKGKSYIGNKYNFEDEPSLYHERKDEIVSKFPIGLETTCYVNQNNPAEAVL